MKKYGNFVQTMSNTILWCKSGLSRRDNHVTDKLYSRNIFKMREIVNVIAQETKRMTKKLITS